MNTIRFEFGKIILTLESPNDWAFAKTITGKVQDVAPGVFELALSIQNMHRIVTYFKGDRKPVVTGSRRFLDELTVKLKNYKQSKEKGQEIMSLERYPVEPNGRFIPYAHQTKIIGVINNNPFSPVFSDCGTGKSGALARAVELCISNGSITKGRVLVSAPLSILHTSWLDDVSRFTNLKAALLWTPLSNKVMLGEEKVILGNYPPKESCVVASKSKTGTVFVRGSEVKSQITSLDGQGWVKHSAKWRVGVDINGAEYPYGNITGRVATKEETRSNFIRDQLNRTDVDLYIVNHDGVRIYEKELKAHNFEWVICDESTKIKSPKTKIFRSHVNISWKSKRRNILTGTPNPNGFIDLWAPYFFLDRGLTLEPCMMDFLYEYFKPEKIGFFATKDGAKDAVQYVLKGEEAKQALIARVRSSGIFLEQRDCIDLPPRADTRRIAYMTPAQETAYDRMAVELVTELKNESSGKVVGVEAVNVLAKIMKLRQITSGFLLNKEEVVHLENNPKWEILDEYIEELGDKKVVIACQFVEEVRLLTERYRHLGARSIYGGVNVEERSIAIRDFQKEKSKQVIVLQPAAAAHGITLTAASHMVFASLDYNFEYYYQTAKRIERIGQALPIFICHLLARYRDETQTIDEDLMAVLQSKSLDRTALFQGSGADVTDIANRMRERLIQHVEKRK